MESHNPMHDLYRQRLGRYTTALRNAMPDAIPIRPFVAEFTAKYAGFTVQEVTHDYDKALLAVRKCAADFDWDAMVANMVYVWTGLTEAIGLQYYAIPGVHVPPTVGFQYREPAPENAFMKADEYDALIDDPVGFLYDVWLPRVAAPVRPIGEPCTREHNLSFVKGGMAMLKYFMDLGVQVGRMREETGTVSAIAGILKAPMDIIADKLRGYLGLVHDLQTQPGKVLAACEALMPHLLQVALTSSDPSGAVPIGLWMHRGCVPFVSFDIFDNIYWPTLKPIIEELWKKGRQTLFYAEGNWDHHLEAFAQLPAGSIVFHVDRGDIFKTHRVLGTKFCLSGGIPNYLLAFGTEQEVRDCCKAVIDGVARDGGYILDASAIIQNDAKIETLRAMTDYVREHGVYSRGHAAAPDPVAAPPSGGVQPIGRATRTPPGVCIPWETEKAKLPPIVGDEALLRRIWEEIDAMGYSYIWQILLSF